MEMVDKEKLEKAIIYLQRMTEGKNPINNLPADEDSALNNLNIIRCMAFVKDILEEVKKNNGYIGKKTKNSDKAEFPIEVLESFIYKEDKAVTKFVSQINELIDENVYKKVSYKMITRWLKLNDFLYEEHSSKFNKTITLPTEKGIEHGIRAERRSTRGVEYMLVIYGKQAQEYIIHNMKEILSLQEE